MVRRSWLLSPTTFCSVNIFLYLLVKMIAWHVHHFIPVITHNISLSQYYSGCSLTKYRYILYMPYIFTASRVWECVDWMYVMYSVLSQYIVVCIHRYPFVVISYQQHSINIILYFADLSYPKAKYNTHYII